MSNTREPRRLELEVEFEPTPIRGRLYERGEGRLDRAFSGWLGLMAAIEAARLAAQPGSSKPARGERAGRAAPPKHGE